MTAANLSATPSRRSACPSNITPQPEVMRPPSKAAVIFLRPTAGNENGRRLSSIMAAVTSMRWLKDRCKQLIHTLNQHLTLHPPAQNQALGEVDGLTPSVVHYWTPPENFASAHWHDRCSADHHSESCGSSGARRMRGYHPRCLMP